MIIASGMLIVVNGRKTGSSELNLTDDLRSEINYLLLLDYFSLFSNSGTQSNNASSISNAPPSITSPSHRIISPSRVFELCPLPNLMSSYLIRRITPPPFPGMPSRNSQFPNWPETQVLYSCGWVAGLETDWKGAEKYFQCGVIDDAKISYGSRRIRRAIPVLGFVLFLIEYPFLSSLFYFDMVIEVKFVMYPIHERFVVGRSLLLLLIYWPFYFYFIIIFFPSSSKVKSSLLTCSLFFLPSR